MRFGKKDNINNLNVRDNNMRICHKKNELKNNLLQSIILDNRIKYKIRLILKSYNHNNKGFFTLIRNRCIFTGKTRSILKYSKMSRITFRENLRKGFFSGFYKI